MSDFVDYNMQLANLEDLDSIDWAPLDDQVLWEPWMDQVDWTGGLVPGADAAPDAGPSNAPTVFNSELSVSSTNRAPASAPTSACGMSDINDYVETISHLEDIPQESNLNPGKFKCNSKGCKSKIFKRKGDLRRHERIHDVQVRFPCTALDCKRKGKNGFPRRDKLHDHIIAGHDIDTEFNCSDKGCVGLCFSRDLVVIHMRTHNSTLTHGLANCRDCPFPKCSYKIHIRHAGRTLDPLQNHLLENHDARSRANFAGLLMKRGYDAKTAEVVCPLCPTNIQFLDHSAFYHHFLGIHYVGPSHNINTSTTLSGRSDLQILFVLSDCSFVPDAVRQHRRTILSLWPAFEGYPVWEDIKRIGAEVNNLKSSLFI